uniref:Uncharacterized protein n=1 Tax=Oryza glumipatula TaxID=40148 RepID=A0A0D9YMB3_9ORYZ
MAGNGNGVRARFDLAVHAPRAHRGLEPVGTTLSSAAAAAGGDHPQPAAAGPAAAAASKAAVEEATTTRPPPVCAMPPPPIGTPRAAAAASSTSARHAAGREYFHRRRHLMARPRRHIALAPMPSRGKQAHARTTDAGGAGGERRAGNGVAPTSLTRSEVAKLQKERKREKKRRDNFGLQNPFIWSTSLSQYLALKIIYSSKLLKF